MVYFGLSFSRNVLILTLSALTLMGAGLFQTALANDKKPLNVTIDRAKIIRVNQSADTIIIGNPAIVDATIQDARTIVLTGRNFGVTNLIILDSNGSAIVDETIVVKGHQFNTVQVFKQASRETFTCSPICERTLSIGDNQEAFSQVQAQVTSRNNLAEGSARNEQ